MTEEKDFCTSSTVVRTLYRMGGEYGQFVPEQVAEYLRERQIREYGFSPQVGNSQAKF
jgi:phosphopantetheine adenylyltransferase